MKPSSLERESVRLEPAHALHALPPSSGRIVEADDPARETLLAEYMHTFSRHRGLIMLCAICGVALAILLGIASQPVYRTRTSLEIKSLNSDFMDTRSVNPTGDNTATDGDINLQTQIKLLESDTLQQQVASKLMSEPHPESVEREDLVSKMERSLHVATPKPTAYSDLIAQAAKSVKVKPLGVTRLVEITCDSWNAEFSAKYCNVLTSTFEQEDLDTRSSEAEKTSAWLTKQVADVRQHAEETQRQLEAAVGNNGLMLSNSQTSVGEGTLLSLQDELVKAEADRMQKQAATDIAGTAAADTLPDVQDNPAHRAYELKLADLNNQIAALEPPLTEANPKIIHLRSQIKDAEAGLKATATSSTSRENNEYLAAKHREDMLRAAYNAQAATVSSDLQKASQVSLLRRELDSEQQLYQTLLQRAKEAGFASAMQAATIRVVDPARTPKVAASPQRKLAGGAGFAFGSLFGIGLAFYKERNNKVFRMPGDVERYLNVHEIGVIPAIGRGDRPASLLPSARFTGRVLQPHSPQAKSNAIQLTGWNDRFSVAAEAYRNATLSIMLSDSNKRARTYVVSSPSAGEGKTTITSNLGVALSKSRLRVVLVDGDLRRPNLHRAFGLSNDFGLRNILRGDIDIEKTEMEDLTQRTALPNISVIAAGEGSEDSVELLHSNQVEALLTRLSRDFDVVLIDTPPILHMADARILAGQSDGAILIFRAGQTTRDQAANACDLMEHDGVRLVGTILNDFDPNREGQRNYYSSYYRYAQDDSHKVAAAL
jgi:capsular exopolysaccharide synthesis family protein